MVSTVGWAMRYLFDPLSVALSTVLLASCASEIPPTRIGDYVLRDQVATDEALSRVDQRPLEAGLVLVSDTSDAESAPNLPDEALVRLGENLKQEISRAIPVVVKEVLPADDIRPQPHGNGAELAELGRQRGLEYLVVVVVSSTEQEYPVTVFLGWTAHAQPGFRRDNWSLLEFALLDLKNNKTLLRAEGRGWATLDRPTAPAINQWYPVVYLRPEDPERRIWPPTFEGAPNTLRVVSFNQAEKRLVLNLLNSWINYLEGYRAERKSSS